MKRFDQIIGEQAGRVRRDVEQLGTRLMKINGAIEKNCDDELRISLGLRQISRRHLQFNDRVDQVRRRLLATKTLLAFRKSSI